MYIYRYQVLHCSLIVEKALPVILMIDTIYMYKVYTKMHIIMIILRGLQSIYYTILIQGDRMFNVVLRGHPSIHADYVLTITCKITFHNKCHFIIQRIMIR